VKLQQFQAVNTLLANLKTSIGATYCAVDFVKHAYHYRAEFQYRFNHRCNMRTLSCRLLPALIGDPGTPERRLRTTEVSRQPGGL
jgi:hypothetical protein